MKAFRILPWLIGVIGLGMLLGAGFLFQHTREFVASAEEAQGEVIDLVRSRKRIGSGMDQSATYKPVVQFSTNDGREVEFTSTTGSNPPAFTRGERVEVLYQPGTPERAKIASFFQLWGMPLIVGGIGAVFALLGLGFVFFRWRRKRRGQYLRQHGMPVEAKLQSVQLDTSYKVGGRSPYRIHAQWQDLTSREIHVFSSDPIWFDPANFLEGEDVTVYIERGNPRRYHVDISFLPQAADA